MLGRVMGVTDSFEALYEASYGPTVAGLSLLAGNTARAEDAVQEAYARLYSRWSRISRYDDPGAWVRRVAINLLRDDARRRSRITGGDSLVDLVGKHADATDRVVLVRAMSLLSFEHRQVLVLRHFFDLTMQAVAADLDIPVGTAASRLSRAHAALRAALVVPHLDQDMSKESTP